ncbi:FAD-dependent oxidoreductase [Demequina sp. TTPB684]|uniref:protoporphyrinogen/coproporphyrinogen oxidase n=1 Tax=unclassified Demequina TaxID=2620311 RepID=UPI001CF54235|nr:MULTISPECIES: FAD-dependent oxidoreductase [unclassified Demequina]MCB2412530.1 FAD-dependent oxidoreductase [Demequina sp. TTPB684]UPU87347.1 FAD-dependent oxidoreductase [Demequina sp. TMPB413]
MSSSPAKRWVVIGGGIAGLLAARRLAGEGHEVTLLESDREVGGRLRHIDVAGHTLDAGAESFATRGDAVQRLCNELGLADAVVSPTTAPAWVVGRDTAYPLPVTGWLGIPLKPFAPDVRRILGWRGSLRASLDLLLPTTHIGEGATVGRIAATRLGRRATDRLLAPVMSGVYSRPLDDLPLDAIAPGLAADVRERGGLIRAARSRRAFGTPGAAVRGLVGGMATLAKAVAADAVHKGAALRTGVTVTGLHVAGDGWRLETNEGPIEADAVVVAVPRHRLAAVMNEDATPARCVAIVVMVLDAPALDAAPRGTGVLVRQSATRAKALTHASAKWPWLASRLPQGRHVLRLSYAVTPGEDVRSHALADASRLLGVELSAEQVAGIEQVEWPDASPAAVADRQPRPGVHLVGSAAGLSGLAAIVAADESADFT